MVIDSDEKYKRRKNTSEEQDGLSRPDRTGAAAEYKQGTTSVDQAHAGRSGSLIKQGKIQAITGRKESPHRVARQTSGWRAGRDSNP
jgi:hypothetical protein